ncbi:condensin complex subunit 2 isoform X1 [Citrus clementina]|uniref:condensin complex subunit 2 isoform X1 n=1 Tax=Citrus clementina TaxID=85681 RepID=UPI000CED6504|nr:condensin complex subunit 2 isoform X1 [Citrus x clementina]
MSEALSPRQRGTMSNRLHSPTRQRQFFLGSNNDQLEREQARAARASAIRRRKATSTSSSPLPEDPCLSEEQIVELLQNCIKLASENKINQNNTWELKLIDHLSEIIKVETVGDAETNFQKASCTLEAGVKIYSVRVDAVHAQAYKVLGGITRAGQEDDRETITAGENVDNRTDAIHPKRDFERKISPLSTLESSFETFNVKKFDVAFAADPLYHQTSAQFDEGGARGLLLNNLGVYGGCRVLFDSLEVPGRCESYSLQNNSSDMIDISFATELIGKIVSDMHAKTEISPTLRAIICQFDEDNQRSQIFSLGENIDFRLDGLGGCANASHTKEETFFGNEDGLDDSSFGNYKAWGYDHDGGTSVVNESSSFHPTFPGDHEEFVTFLENDPCGADELGINDRFEDVTMFLFQGLGFTSKQNAWAGPDHWKYQKSKENASPSESGSAFNPKKQKKKFQAEVDIDFTKSLDEEMLDIFAPPRNPKSLLRPSNRPSCSNVLPEDCHYQPENLVKLFLLPNVLCMGKWRRKLSDNYAIKQNCDYARTLPSWDNESVVSGQYDDRYDPNDLGDLDGLVSQPRQVEKIEVQHDKSSKQVNIHVLKETLWYHVQEITEVPGTVCKDKVSFRHVLGTFPADCAAAASKDISPHLCFICLLHLANEHGLIIRDCPSLDDLSIYLHSTQQNTDRQVQDAS